MKRIYTEPSCQAYDIKTSEILAGSPKPKVEPGQETPNMDAKGGIFFDDEDEDEK